jgi:hypothetical protein
VDGQHVDVGGSREGQLARGRDSSGSNAWGVWSTSAAAWVSDGGRDSPGGPGRFMP